MNKLTTTNYQTANSTSIIENLRKGDYGLMTFVYDAIFPACAKYIRDNNGNSRDAEDVFQEALLILLKKVEQPHFELTSSLKTYLYAIVRNLWLKQLGKTKRRGHVVNIDDYSLAFSLVATSDHTLEMEGLTAKSHSINIAIQSLKSDARHIIENYYYQRKPLKEIAKEMGYTEAYIRVKKNRVMKKLQQKMMLNKKAAA